MFDLLEKVENNLFEIIKPLKMNTMYINYGIPIVERIWYQWGNRRIYFHKIHRTEGTSMLHNHPWPNAIRVLRGSYEMGIGHSSTNEAPVTLDAKMVMKPGSKYEMVTPGGWHYVNPVSAVSYSLMVADPPFERIPSHKPGIKFRELTDAEISDIMTVFEQEY